MITTNWQTRDVCVLHTQSLHIQNQIRCTSARLKMSIFVAIDTFQGTLSPEITNLSSSPISLNPNWSHSAPRCQHPPHCYYCSRDHHRHPFRVRRDTKSAAKSSEHLLRSRRLSLANLKSYHPLTALKKEFPHLRRVLMQS